MSSTYVFLCPGKRWDWKEEEEKELWDKIMQQVNCKEFIKYKYSCYYLESLILVLSFLLPRDGFVQQCGESLFDLCDYKFSK